MMTKGLMIITVTIDDCRGINDSNDDVSDVDMVVNVEMTGTITITTRVTTIKSITLISMATIFTMRRRAAAILPTENSDVYGNAKDNDNDNCENDVVTGFIRENSAYILKVRHIRRPI